MRGPLMDRFSTEDDSNLWVPEQCVNRAKRCCDMIENYFLRTKWGVSISYLVGGIPTPLKIYGKIKNVPNHQ